MYNTIIKMFKILKVGNKQFQKEKMKNYHQQKEKDENLKKLRIKK